MARDENGEDVQKFLGELPSLIPAVDRIEREDKKVRRHLRLNRADAREAGLPTEKQRHEAALQKAYEAHKVNEYFDLQMKTRYPRLFNIAFRLGRPGLIKLLGFRFIARDEMHRVSSDWRFKPRPATLALIFWGPFLLVGQRFIWPSKEELKQERRIIQ